MVHQWGMRKVKNWTIEELRNWIWMHSIGQLIPGCVSAEALRVELVNRGEEPNGCHNASLWKTGQSVRHRFYRGDVSAYKKPCSNQWGRSRDQRHG